MKESERADLMTNIAWDIEKLSSNFKQEKRTDYKTAFGCLEVYRSTFGDEGLAYLENKTDELIKKFEFEKPDDKGLLEIENFLDKVETPRIFKFHVTDPTAFDLFIVNEKEKIDAFIQGQTPPLERRNINSKEKNMSDDQNEDFEWDAFKEMDAQRQVSVDAFKADMAREERTPEEKAFLAQAHQRKVIADAISNGTLSCLPGEDGYADTEPAVNLVDGGYYHGANMLYLKEFQKENKFPTAEFIPSGQIDKAKQDHPEISIRKGQHGVTIQWSEKNEETDQYEKKTARLFNVAQTTKPDLVREWAEKKQEEKQQERLAYLQTKYGGNYELPEKKERVPGPEITCTSTEPEKYLGQYLAAVSMGSKFKASPEQAAEFSEKMVASMYEPVGPKVDKATGAVTPPKINPETNKPYTNPFKLSQISNSASQYCKEFIKETQAQTQANQPKQEQQQSRGMGR
jgi:hypothetical protein